MRHLSRKFKKTFEGMGEEDIPLVKETLKEVLEKKKLGNEFEDDGVCLRFRRKLKHKFFFCEVEQSKRFPIFEYDWQGEIRIDPSGEGLTFHGKLTRYDLFIVFWVYFLFGVFIFSSEFYLFGSGMNFQDQVFRVLFFPLLPIAAVLSFYFCYMPFRIYRLLKLTRSRVLEKKREQESVS